MMAKYKDGKFLLALETPEEIAAMFHTLALSPRATELWIEEHREKCARAAIPLPAYSRGDAESLCISTSRMFVQFKKAMDKATEDFFNGHL